MSDPDLEKKIAEFTAFCVCKVNALDQPEALFLEDTEIKPIIEAHRRIFGTDPSGATVVRIVGRDQLKEAGDRMFIHSCIEFPPYLLKAISLCGVETKILKGREVPNWNGPPETDVRVCLL
jgi:hypothetical protein